MRGRLAGASAMWLAAGFCLVATMHTARGQEASGLRGGVVDSDVNAELLSPTEALPDTPSNEHTGSIDRGTTGATSAQYEPFTPGALPDEDTAAASDPDDPASATRSSGSATSLGEADGAGGRTVDGPRAASDEDDPATGSIRARPAETVGAEDDTTARRMNLRVGAIESDVRRPEEDDAYAPLGIRAGRFLLSPTLEQGLEWSSNANAVPDGDSALLSNTTLRVGAKSDWSRHAATIDAYGTYRESISGADISEFEGGVDAGLRLDFANDVTGLARLGYNIAPEDASSPVVIANVRDRPLRQTFDAGVGLEKTAGKLRFGLYGDASRDQYGEATLEDGSRLAQGDRDNTLLTTRLRGGYSISPALTPFVEGEIGRRIYDDTRDSAGFERSAIRLGARAGVALDLGEKLSGEASFGWISEDPDDSRLGSVSGPSAAANLSWSPMRGTIVALDGTTTVETTPDAGESGSLLYLGQLSVERQIRANLTGTALAGAAWRDYAGGGTELTLFGEAALTWWLNRNLGITGRVRHERLTSDLAGRDYAVSSVFVGMKLQR